MSESIVDGIGSGNYAHVDNQNRLWVNVSGTVNSDETTYIQTLAYTASNLPEYIGKAVADSNKSGAVWQIQKLTYNTSNMVTDIKFASGTTSFINIWSGATINYTTYPYS